MVDQGVSSLSNVVVSVFVGALAVRVRVRGVQRGGHRGHAHHGRQPGARRRAAAVALLGRGRRGQGPAGARHAGRGARRLGRRGRGGGGRGRRPGRAGGRRAAGAGVRRCPSSSSRTRGATRSSSTGRPPRSSWTSCGWPACASRCRWRPSGRRPPGTWSPGACPAGVGAVAGQVLGRAAVSSVPHPWRWLRDNREMGVRFLGEFVTGQSVGQFVVLGVGAIAGLGTLGAVRAAQIVLRADQHDPRGHLPGPRAGGGPAPGRASPAAAPDGRRRAGCSWPWRPGGRSSACSCPPAGAPSCSGESWADAADLLGPLGLAMMAGSAATGGYAGLRSLGAARASLRARLRDGPAPTGAAADGHRRGRRRGLRCRLRAGHVGVGRHLLDGVPAGAARLRSTGHGPVDERVRVPAPSV